MRNLKIPFPDHLFKDMSPDKIAFLKEYWDSDPEIFHDNLEKALGIKIEIIDLEKGIMKVHKRKEGE